MRRTFAFPRIPGERTESVSELVENLYSSEREEIRYLKGELDNPLLCRNIEAHGAELAWDAGVPAPNA